MPTSESTPLIPISYMPRVLVVDDEPTPRSGLCRMVKGMGYEVHAVGDGRAALRYLQQHPGEVRLLLTNLFLPSMDGGELAERARDLEPGLRVVLMPSGPQEAASDLLTGYRDLPVLEKPIAFGRLYELLVERLGPPRAGALRPRPSRPVQFGDRTRGP
jgi:CheY-like chemotaxis protein